MRCKERLDDHDERHDNHEDKIKHQEKRLPNEDAILAKTSETLESLKDTHAEHMRLAKATHGMAVVSYFKWHGNDKAVDRLKAENMTKLYDEVILFKKKPL